MSGWLTQAEADALLVLEKHREDEKQWRLPDLGGGLIVPLSSVDRAEAFHLDISRGRINLNKGKYQTRARSVVVLARLDFGVPHRNPDDQEVPAPHLHVYREGYGDKWAFPVPAEHFTNLEDRWQALMDFLRFCAVTRPPHFEKGLFT